MILEQLGIPALVGEANPVDALLALEQSGMPIERSFSIASDFPDWPPFNRREFLCPGSLDFLIFIKADTAGV